MNIVYTVWLRDNSADPSDPDHEWPACFVVVAASAAAGQEWGDHLARVYSADRGLEFLRSISEPADVTGLPGVDGLPVVNYGHEATREEIGW